MGTAFRTRVVKIGNSQGVRIPKPLLEQAGLGERVEIEVEGSQIVIRPTHRAREGWQRQFQERGDDCLLDADALSLMQWDQDEWEW
jgi:antitoxin MazE